MFKKYGSLWQYYKDELNSTITNSESFKSKLRETGTTPPAGNTKDAEIAVALKYLSNFWSTLEMPLINCEINLILLYFFSPNCVINNFTRAEKFAITDTKLYTPVVTLLTQDNAKLLQQLKPGFKRTIKWNKYQSKLKI